MSTGQPVISVLTLQREGEDRSKCLFRMKRGSIRYDVCSMS
jgi:hypothetical protein